MQNLRPEASLYVANNGKAILYRLPIPFRNGDVIVTDDIRVAAPVWRPLIIRPLFTAPHRHTIEYGDPVKQIRGWLRLEQGVLRAGDLAYFRQPIGMSHGQVMPFPLRQTPRLVGEIPSTGERVAVLADPSLPLARTVQVRRGHRARPTGWRSVQVTGLSDDDHSVYTTDGTVDLRFRAWNGLRLTDVPEEDWGLDAVDQWGMPLPRHAGARQANVALIALLAGIVLLLLGVGLGAAL